MRYRLTQEYKIVARSPETRMSPRIALKVLPKGAVVDLVDDRYVPKDHPLWPDIWWSGRMRHTGEYHRNWFFTAYGLIPLSMDDVEAF